MTGGVPGQICLMQGNEAIVRGAVEAGLCPLQPNIRKWSPLSSVASLDFF